jgi:hypothetical protein
VILRRSLDLGEILHAISDVACEFSGRGSGEEIMLIRQSAVRTQTLRLPPSPSSTLLRPREGGRGGVGRDEERWRSSGKKDRRGLHREANSRRRRREGNKVREWLLEQAEWDEEREREGGHTGTQESRRRTSVMKREEAEDNEQSSRFSIIF